jgi:hypothetical protein
MACSDAEMRNLPGAFSVGVPPGLERMFFTRTVMSPTLTL